MFDNPIETVATMTPSEITALTHEVGSVILSGEHMRILELLVTS